MEKRITDLNEAIRNIVKGHLVNQHGEMLNSELSDDLSIEICESIQNYMDNVAREVQSM